MGWSFNCVDYGRKAFIESLTGPRHFAQDYQPLEYRVVGNNVWHLVLHKPTNCKFISLDMIAKARSGGWGHKGMGEDSGPRQLNCPLSLLNKADPPRNEWAAKWRERVRQYHVEQQRAQDLRKKLEPGSWLTLAGVEYTLIRPLEGTRGAWEVRSEGGARYKMSGQQVNRALQKSAEDPAHA